MQSNDKQKSVEKMRILLRVLWTKPVLHTRLLLSGMVVLHCQITDCLEKRLTKLVHVWLRDLYCAAVFDISYHVFISYTLFFIYFFLCTYVNNSYNK